MRDKQGTDLIERYQLDTLGESNRLRKMGNGLPRKKATYTHRPVTIYIKPDISDKDIDTRVKHQLIATIINHFKVSQRDAINALKKVTAHLFVLPNQPAFSLYLNKYKKCDAVSVKDNYKHAIHFLSMKNVDVYDCHLTIGKFELKKGKPSIEHKYATVYLKVNDSDVPPWYARNIDFLKDLSKFINNDSNYYDLSINRIVEAIKNASPEIEMNNIDNPISWYRRNISKKLSNPIPNYLINSTPLQAEIFILESSDEDVVSEVDSKPYFFMALKHHDCIGYIPITLSKNAQNKLLEALQTLSNPQYAIKVKKQGEAVLVQLRISNERTQKEEKEEKIKKPPTLSLITKIRHQKPTYNDEECLAFNIKLKDGVYTVKKNGPLKHRFFKINTKLNKHSFQGISSTINSIHHIMSELSTSSYQDALFQAYKIKKRKGRNLTVKNKPLQKFELDTMEHLKSYYIKRNY